MGSEIPRLATFLHLSLSTPSGSNWYFCPLGITSKAFVEVWESKVSFGGLWGVFLVTAYFLAFSVGFISPNPLCHALGCGPFSTFPHSDSSVACCWNISEIPIGLLLGQRPSLSEVYMG